MSHLEVQRLLEERHLLEGGAYFNVDTQRCNTYLGPSPYSYWKKYNIAHLHRKQET